MEDKSKSRSKSLNECKETVCHVMIVMTCGKELRRDDERVTLIVEDEVPGEGPGYQGPTSGKRPLAWFRGKLPSNTASSSLSLYSSSGSRNRISGAFTCIHY